METLRERILSAAVRILFESGLRKLAQPQIAKAAKIRQSHLTYYFPTRSDLILAVTERALSSLFEKFGRPLGLLTSENQILSEVGRLLGETQRTRALIGLLVESDENSDLKNSLQAIATQEQRMIAFLSGKLEDDPHVILTHACLWGLALQNYLFHDKGGIRDFKPLLGALSRWLLGSPTKRIKRGKKK